MRISTWFGPVQKQHLPLLPGKPAPALDELFSGDGQSFPSHR